MARVRSDCRVCGGSLPPDAQFCPECGLPVDTNPVDSLDLGVSSSMDVTAVGSIAERSRYLVIALAIVAMMLLGWSTLNDSGDGSSDTAGSTTTEARSSVTTTLVRASTTMVRASTVAPTAPSTSSAPLQSAYFNNIRGPVLGEGIGGLVFAVANERVTMMDLASGEINSVPHGMFGPEVASVDGDEVMLQDGRTFRSINLRTGDRSLLRPFGEPDRGYDWIAGSGGPGSVWLVEEDESSSASTVSRIDFGGQVIQSFEFDSPFWVRFANGSKLYLDGPSGSWVFDALTSSVSALNGQVLESNSDAVVVLSCGSTLQCQVSIDKGAGMEPTAALTATDVAEHAMHISPDLERALVHRWIGRWDFTYIDLETGDRRELGHLPIDAQGEVSWVPDSSWIISMVDEEGLVAVNLETEDVVELLPGVGGGRHSFEFSPAN